MEQHNSSRQNRIDAVEDGIFNHKKNDTKRVEKTDKSTKEDNCKKLEFGD